MGEKKRRLAMQAVAAAGPTANDSDAVPASVAFLANAANPSGVATSTLAARSAQAADVVTQALRHARLDLQAGKLVEAINRYQQVLRDAPRLPPAARAQARHFQGLALLQAGQVPAGIGLMRQSLQDAPDSALYHYNLALALTGPDPAQGLSLMRRAWELDTQDADVTQALAGALLQAGLRDEAKGVLQAGPATTALLDLLAQWQFADNQLTQAVDTFARASAQHPALLLQRRIGFSSALTAARAETRLAGEGWLQELDLHILDDCLPDPETCRERILRLPFHARRYAGQNYPGLQTDGMDVPDIMQIIATQLGKTIKYISPDNGSCRASFADSMARSDIHADNESGADFQSYAAVLYLNLPSQCQGGTSFWQHQATGWRRRPPDAEVRAAGFADFKSFLQRALPRHEAGQEYNLMLAQREGWQCSLQVPMQFNRLIIYRGDFFHSIGDVFGSTLQDARLAQLFFFDVVP